VAAFNVVSALVMIVTDKRADIAILRSLGASSGGIMSIFMVQGTMIGLIGTGLGALLGVLLSLLVTDVVGGLERLFQLQFLNSDVYPINYLPSDLRLEDVVLVCSTALVMSVLATLYPAWRAVRVQPAEALRYQ
jgi:lipoprotein-releasing system permease protein